MNHHTNLTKRRRVPLRLLWLAMLVALAGGVAQQQPLRTISSAAACPSCRIFADSGPTLVLPTESLSFDKASKLVAVSGGRYVAWRLSETNVPAIFDSAGRFLRLVGNIGQGPGELRLPLAVIAAPGDTVWIIDEGLRGRHVLDGDLRIVRMERSEVTVSDIVFGPNGAHVGAGVFRTPERAGLPLHIFDRGGSIRRSFGVADPTLDPRRLAASGDEPASLLMRQLTNGEPSSFWTYNPTRFLLEQYDFEGRLLRQARHALDGWYEDATRRSPGAGELRGLPLSIVQVSRDAGLLWLVYHDRNSDYTPNNPRDRSLLPQRIGHDLVVEALDWRTMRVQAMLRLPNTYAVRVSNAPDLIAIVRPQNADFHTLQPTRLRLQR